MRTKENANDYRFIKEPDIPAIDISDLKKNTHVEYAFLPYQIEKILIKNGLTVGEAKYFSSDIKKAHMLFSINDKVNDMLGISKILMNFISVEDYEKLDIEILSEIIVYQKEKKFNKDLLKQIIRKTIDDKKFDYIAYVNKHMSSVEDFSDVINEVLDEKKDIVEKIQKGDDKKINLLV
jgi:Asp-tRNA(Asn)/Glu-tRNA(Gln) amidotransferase B subunit